VRPPGIRNLENGVNKKHHGDGGLLRTAEGATFPTIHSQGWVTWLATNCQFENSTFNCIFGAKLANLYKNTIGCAVADVAVAVAAIRKFNTELPFWGGVDSGLRRGILQGIQPQSSTGKRAFPNMSSSIASKQVFI